MTRRARMSGWLVPIVAAAASLGPRAAVAQQAGAPAAQIEAKRPTPVDPGTADPSFTPPRTPWGDPDLQGVYTRMHFIVGAVPFERPREFGTRTELTEAELKQRMDERDRREREGLNRATGTSFDDEISPYLKPSRQTSIVVDPPDGRIPPYTPEGRKRVEAAEARRRPHSLADIGPGIFGLEERCITRGFPIAMNLATQTSAGMQLIQGPGWVVIQIELLNEYRLIPLDGRPTFGPKMRQWWGQSRGRWEGNTLVVETTNVNGRTEFRGVGEQLRLVERFTPISYGELDYTYTLEDPGTFTRPWTIHASWGRHEQLEITEYACHPGNKDLPKMIEIAQQQFEKAQKSTPAQTPEQKR